MSKSGKDGDRLRPATRLVRLGREKSLTGPFVNPPVIHASTVLFDSAEDMIHRRQRYVYGRRGTPTSEALETALTGLENAAGTVLCPSGLAAVSTALLATLGAGDHLLMVDCAYAPARTVANTVLARLGVSTTYFDPAIGTGIKDLLTDRTRAVYLEAPGSLTFEMQDLPAIAGIAHAAGALVIFDNTWATPYFCRPLDLGADLSVQAGTKYIGGHSDVMIGTVAANAGAWPRLKETHGVLGQHVAPDDIYLTTRGLRTLGVRLERHQQSAAIVAQWLCERPEIERVLYPALPTDPGHDLWKRDMTGASGLFAIALADRSEADANLFIDALQLFGIGASWGGFESLAIPAMPRPARTAGAWPVAGPLVRIHVGLEDPDDLLEDLDQAFAAIKAR